MYLLKYFRKLYLVFLYIKIILYYIEEKNLEENNKICKKNKIICFFLILL